MMKYHIKIKKQQMHGFMENYWFQLNVWIKKRKNDEIFNIYRWEYKKRFGWIKTGKIEQDAFYTWGKKTREQKTRCNTGEISLQEFSEWLKGF